MKTILAILILWIISPVVSNAQVVIYADDQTGAWGAGYNNDNKPTTMKECTDLAIKMCKSKGGKDCTLLHKSTKQGWCAMVSGKKKDGRNYFQGVDGCKTKEEAERTVRNKYLSDGGVDSKDLEIKSWYAYSNEKKTY